METKILAIGTSIVVLSCALLYKLGTNWIDNVSADLKKALAKMLEVDTLQAKVTNLEKNLVDHIERSDARFSHLEDIGNTQLRVQRKTYRMLKAIYGRRSDDKPGEK